jgi:hypothetical protein
VDAVAKAVNEVQPGLDPTPPDVKTDPVATSAKDPRADEPLPSNIDPAVKEV